ncbi:hypothetical protein [Streptomyces catenulae]|uniref:DUF4352 domain-containing protein n=1 Tax=Streptomyces catenulae TaxID=66875 RepID=A0ABV2Z484_9ACTN|nr:hypothetical protein [Streptomyces catenulae]
MQQRTRTRARAAVAAVLVAVTAAAIGGCGRLNPFGYARPTLSTTYSPSPGAEATPTYGAEPTDAYSPEYSPSPTMATYDPDGRSDVRGSGCDFSNSLHEFTYRVSVTNTSLSDTFSYDMEIDWMKARPADGTSYGRHTRSITVAPGATETYTARYTVNQSSIGRFWFTCQVTRAEKSRM